MRILEETTEYMKDLRKRLWQYSVQKTRSSCITSYVCHVVSARDSILHTQCPNCSVLDHASAAVLRPRNGCTTAAGKAPGVLGRFAR